VNKAVFTDRDGTIARDVPYCICLEDFELLPRKPQPKMVFQAALDMGIELGQSYVIGDTDMDIEMARQAGCRAAVGVGQAVKCAADYSAASYMDAVKGL